MDAPEEITALFPHVRQIAKVIRTRTVTAWKSDGKTRTRVTRTSTETVYLVTSLSAREAAPEHIAAYIRSHWGIENQVHWVRDVTLREDASKVRAASRPRNIATLRNLQTGLIRQHGRTGIAATLRDTEYDNDPALRPAAPRTNPLNSTNDFVRSPAHRAGGSPTEDLENPVHRLPAPARNLPGLIQSSDWTLLLQAYFCISLHVH